MPQPHRLRKHADYQNAYSRSRRQSSKHIAYFASLRPADRRSETPGPRIGLTVPKALGKAHDRNRIKRRMRAAIRANLHHLRSPADLILHPRRSVLTADFAGLSRELSVIFRAVENAVSREIATLARPNPSPALSPNPSPPPPQP